MPGYNNKTSAELGGVIKTITKRNVGNYEQLLYTASNKSAVVGLLAANVTSGTLPVSVYIRKEISATVSNKALTSNVATLTFSSDHGFLTGDIVTVSGVDATFDGTYGVSSVPENNVITYTRTASNVASTADTGTATVDIVVHVAKDTRVETGKNIELIDKPFVIENGQGIYASSGVANAFDMVLSIQEGVN